MVMMMAPGDWDQCHKKVWEQISDGGLFLSFQLREAAFVNLSDAGQGTDIFSVMLRSNLQGLDIAADIALALHQRALTIHHRALALDHCAVVCKHQFDALGQGLV